MIKFNVIGISGHAGTGKDYFVNNVLRDEGYTVFSFAWHFKIWLVGKGFATYEEVFHTKPPHIRKLLQEEGTERGRMLFGEAVWLNTAHAWMKCLSEFNGFTQYVFADVRFPNEVEFITNLGGRVYRMHAPNREAVSSLSPEARQHISETALDTYNQFSGIIHNDLDVTIPQLVQQWEGRL